MTNPHIPLRLDYAAAACRDANATLETIARSVVYLGRGSSGAISTARTERPKDTTLHDAIRKGAVTIAGTSNTTGLTQSGISAVSSIVPSSVWAAVASRSVGVTLGRNVQQSVPLLSISNSTFTFIPQGAAIPVFQGSFSSVPLTLKKAGVITVMTDEIVRSANADVLMKQQLAESVPPGLDKYLLDDQAATDDRPAGLLHGTSAETSGGDDAMVADLALIASNVAAVAGNLDNIIYIASPDIAVKIGIALPLFKFPVFASAGLPEKTIAAIAVNALAFAADPTVNFSVSEETVLHMSDAPGPLSAAGSPATTSAPNRSLFQTQCSAVRLTFNIDWAWRTENGISWLTSLAW